MQLNVLLNGVAAGDLVYAPGVAGANANGFISVGALIAEADAALAANGNAVDGSPARAYQELLKNALDKANNNNTTFVVPFAAAPTPVFPAPVTEI